MKKVPYKYLIDVIIRLLNSLNIPNNEYIKFQCLYYDVLIYYGLDNLMKLEWTDDGQLLAVATQKGY